MAGQLRALIVPFPAPRLDDLQAPLTPAPGVLTLSSGLQRHCNHMHMSTHVHVIKKIKL